MRKLEKNAAVGRGDVGGRKVLLVKPVTFMVGGGLGAGGSRTRRVVSKCWGAWGHRRRNRSWRRRRHHRPRAPPAPAAPSSFPLTQNNSGESVAALAKYYKVGPDSGQAIRNQLGAPTPSASNGPPRVFCRQVPPVTPPPCCTPRPLQYTGAAHALPRGRRRPRLAHRGGAPEAARRARRPQRAAVNHRPPRRQERLSAAQNRWAGVRVDERGAQGAWAPLPPKGERRVG
jgi:hypothetical protein